MAHGDDRLRSFCTKHGVQYNMAGMDLHMLYLVDDYSSKTSKSCFSINYFGLTAWSSSEPLAMIRYLIVDIAVVQPTSAISVPSFSFWPVLVHVIVTLCHSSAHDANRAWRSVISLLDRIVSRDVDRATHGISSFIYFRHQYDAQCDRQRIFEASQRDLLLQSVLPVRRLHCLVGRWAPSTLLCREALLFSPTAAV